MSNNNSSNIFVRCVNCYYEEKYITQGWCKKCGQSIFTIFDKNKTRHAMIDYILRLFGYYDSRGLKYSIQHLDAIRNYIPFYERKRQADYVDAITKETVINAKIIVHSGVLKTTPEKFHRIEQIKESVSQMNANNWFLQPGINTTSIGNLAYISLHYPDKIIREKADLMLEEYRKYLTINKK